MKVHYKWMLVLTVAASPLFCSAGPMSIDNNSVQGWPLGVHSLGLKIDDDKDDKDKGDKPHDHDRPGHSHNFGSDGHDRGWKDNDGHHENHGRYFDRPCHHRPPWHDPVQTHLGDNDGPSPVPESGSTAMLLCGTLIGLLALAKNHGATAATARIQTSIRRR